jgi:hypothetical protein
LVVVQFGDPPFPARGDNFLGQTNFFHIPSDFVVGVFRPSLGACNGPELPPWWVVHGKEPMTWGSHLRQQARPTREHRTITVDVQHEATDFQLLDDGKAVLECVFAVLLALGFQRTHKATWRGDGCLTRQSHDVRVRLGGVTIWRLQCTTCRVVCTILPPCV